jgi:hypothetical protein
MVVLLFITVAVVQRVHGGAFLSQIIFLCYLYYVTTLAMRLAKTWEALCIAPVSIVPCQ